MIERIDIEYFNWKLLKFIFNRFVEKYYSNGFILIINFYV